MKVAILGAGCYRTHAASGITNFTRACEVAEETGKEKIAMTHSTIEMGAELLHLAGVDEVVVSDPVFDNDFTVVDDFDFQEVIAAHKAGKAEDVMPDIRAKVNELAESLPTPPKAAIHFVDPEDLGMKTMNDDAAAVADADWVCKNLSSKNSQENSKKELSSLMHVPFLPPNSKKYSTNVEQT